MVKKNRYAKCLDQMLFRSNIAVWTRRHTHTTDRLLYTATKVVDN